MLPLKGFLLLCKGSSNKAATAWAILNPNSRALRAFVCKLILSYYFYDVIKVEGMNCNDDWKFFKRPRAKFVDFLSDIQILKIVISWMMVVKSFVSKRFFKKITTVSLCSNSNYIGSRFGSKIISLFKASWAIARLLVITFVSDLWDHLIFFVCFVTLVVIVALYFLYW